MKVDTGTSYFVLKSAWQGLVSSYMLLHSLTQQTFRSNYCVLDAGSRTYNVLFVKESTF